MNLFHGHLSVAQTAVGATDPTLWQLQSSLQSRQALNSPLIRLKDAAMGCNLMVLPLMWAFEIAERSCNKLTSNSEGRFFCFWFSSQTPKKAKCNDQCPLWFKNISPDLKAAKMSSTDVQCELIWDQIFLLKVCFSSNIWRCQEAQTLICIINEFSYIQIFSEGFHVYWIFYTDAGHHTLQRINPC